MLLFIGIMMMLALMAALGVLISVSEIESHQARQLKRVHATALRHH